MRRALRPRYPLRSGPWRADKQKLQQTFRRFEPERGMQPRIVGNRARRSEPAVAKRVNRVEHVHRGGADRQQPLDLGNVRVTRHGRPKRDDQRRGVRALTAMLMHFGRLIGFTRTSNVDENAA
jgi:hypothetical protein